jgi:molybdopterin converting factor small subunit
MQVRVFLSGRHYDTADSLPRELTLPDDCPLSLALSTLLDPLPADRRPPGSCLIAVSGAHMGTLAKHRETTLCHGDELLLLSPVAGG